MTTTLTSFLFQFKEPLWETQIYMWVDGNAPLEWDSESGVRGMHESCHLPFGIFCPSFSRHAKPVLQRWLQQQRFLSSADHSKSSRRIDRWPELDRSTPECPFGSNVSKLRRVCVKENLILFADQSGRWIYRRASFPNTRLFDFFLPFLSSLLPENRDSFRRGRMCKLVDPPTGFHIYRI